LFEDISYENFSWAFYSIQNLVVVHTKLHAHSGMKNYEEIDANADAYLLFPHALYLQVMYVVSYELYVSNISRFSSYLVKISEEYLQKQVIIENNYRACNFIRT
jgi:hypothetical protein